MKESKNKNMTDVVQIEESSSHSDFIQQLKNRGLKDGLISCSAAQFLEEGQRLIEQKKYDSAIEVLELGTNEWPKNYALNGVLADCYKNVGDYEKSANYFEAVVNGPNPVPSWAYVGYANVLELQGEYTLALSNIVEALDLHYSLELAQRAIQLSAYLSSIESVVYSVTKAIDTQIEDCKTRADHYLEHGDHLCQLHQWSLACELYDKSHQEVGDRLIPVTRKLKVLIRNRAVDQAALVVNEWKNNRPGDTRLERFEKICAGMTVADTVRSIAFYLPQYHPIKENSEWWGEGFTEWHNVASARSMWSGHAQPRLPTDLGYYDLRLPETYNKQTALANRYGVDGFCFYYYWFNGRKILETPLQNILDGKTNKFPFCICWVNEDWTRSWDGMSGEVLLSTSHSEEMNLKFIEDVYPIISHDDYIRVDGKPMLIVYCAEKLDVTSRTTDMWREYCNAQGLGEIYIVAVQSFGFGDPTELGYDAALEFPPHAVGGKDVGESHVEIKDVPDIDPDFNGKVYSYQSFADCAISRSEEKYNLHRTCMLAWDNTARRGKEAHIYAHFSVEKYQLWLLENMRKAITEQSDPVVFINAWNEWAEGSTLEPDSDYGHEILSATRRAKRIALWNNSNTHWKPEVQKSLPGEVTDHENILMIGHDAHKNGAQINFLCMLQNLVRDKKKRVTIILIEGGELLSQYEQYGKVYIIGSEQNRFDLFHGIIRDYMTKGASKAICNTCVTGDLTALLNNSGYEVISLVHELPGIISDYGLERNCELLSENAHSVVFASEYVADKFQSVADISPNKVKILSQGIKQNPYLSNKETSRSEIRAEFGIPDDGKIVIGCGYGDMRKGIDYFLQLANTVVKAKNNVYFIWIGELEVQIQSLLSKDISQIPENKILITGFRKDTGRIFSAADVFALTSREDPFPSVVMEAMEAGLPVFGFEGCGGYGSIVNDESGGLVPFGDVASYSEKICKLLSDNSMYEAIAKHNAEYSKARFGYPKYMSHLLDLLNVGVLENRTESLTVSAVIPNYNYSRYLKLRLKTVAEQTRKPDEIIILDDASSDNSLEVIKEFVNETDIPVKVIESTENSGNVFIQWKKGIEETSSDLIWIAEADDYCDQDFLERLCYAFSDEQVVISACNSIMIDGFGNSDGSTYSEYLTSHFGSSFEDGFNADGLEFLNTILVKRNAIMNASAVVFRKDAAQQAMSNLGRLRLSGDWLFWAELCLSGNINYTSDSYNYHRRHSNSVVGQALREKTEIISEMLKMVEIFGENSSSHIAESSLENLLASINQTYQELFFSDADYVSIEEHPSLSADYLRLADPSLQQIMSKAERELAA